MSSRLAALGFGLSLIAASAAAQTGSALVTAADSSARVYRSDHSGFSDASRLVVRDDKGWHAVWATIALGRADSARPPKIDFRREFLIVAALGARPTAGYRVTIDSVLLTGITIQAIVRSYVPGSDCLMGFTITQPVVVIRVRRSERPVEFIEQRIVEPCGRE